MKRERSKATFTVRRASEMTRRERKAIAVWLRRTARSLELEGWNYAARFTARYMA